MRSFSSTRPRSRREVIDNSLGALLKYQDDIQKIRGSEAAKILEEIKLEVQTARLHASLSA
jgi:hypothetical protein